LQWKKYPLLFLMEEVETYSHVTPVQIRFNDIDIMGHVNNAVHQYYYDYARLQYFRDVFGRLISWNEQALVLASIHVNYQEPIGLDEQIEVHTRITRIGNKSIGMAQRIVSTHTGTVKSYSESVLVGYDRKKGATFSIPQEWRERISWFEHARF